MPDADQTTPEPVDLDAFDLDGFINGTVHPSRTVAVTNNRALGQQIQEAAQEVARLLDEERDAAATGRPSKRRAATTEAPELEEAREALARLEEQAAGSFVWVRIEGTLDAAVKAQALKDAKAAGGDVTTYNLSVLAHTARVHKVDPRTHEDAAGAVMPLEQWQRFMTSIGALQHEAIMNALVEVNEVGVTPDFSQPASPSPDGGESSKN